LTAVRDDLGKRSGCGSYNRGATRHSFHDREAKALSQGREDEAAGGAVQRWERLLGHVTQKADAVVHTEIVRRVKQLVSLRIMLASHHELHVWQIV
jgi:hypothetical protein